MIAIAVIVQVAFGVSGGSALYFYAGVTAARLADERLAIGAIAAAGIAATMATGVGSGDWSDGLVVGMTVATISLTLFALARLGRANRELQAARRELADLAVAEERTRIARDLHDTLGHSLSVIALKSELARRVLPDDPERAAAEIGDVERVAREALASVRDTVSGYRQPTLAMELAGARAALTAAGIDGDVEPAPEGLPLDVDAVLGWAVREGVTNVLRHSDAARANIRVIVDDGIRGVEVEDDGPGVSGAPLGAVPDRARAGTGLEGLRERAASVGGSLEAGPRADGGFRLRVSVPVAPTGSPAA
jgi:two-component system, NarL family, sensor histidine kinase DesK